MRVLLVVPTFHYKDDYPHFLSLSDFPSGFAYLASSLKQAGHEVIGLNPNNITGYVSAKFMLQDVLTKKIKECQPDLIGLGGLCTDYAFLRDAIQIIRGVDPKIPIVLGGQIVTNDAEFIFNDLKPDYAVVGEGEQALKTIIIDINEGLIDHGICPGLAEPNLDSLPFPDYEPFGVQDMLDNHSMNTRLLYRYSRPNPRPFNIVASRSCPFTCTFCVHGHRDVPYRARSIENIMREIKESYDKYKFNILIILDELFAVKNDRLKTFSEAVIEGKQEYGWDFDWMFQTHASARFDLDTLKLAKRAGCFFFSYGLESASPAVLNSMNKKIRVEQVIEAMDLARQAKVGFGANLIFGDPIETKETWAESLAFWLQHGQDNFTFLSQLMPYPGSKVFEGWCVKDKAKYYDKIDEATPNLTKIPDKEFSDLLTATAGLEKSWLFVKLALNVRKELESGLMFKIWATCPYCGEESMYRQEITTSALSLGTGCTKCHRRIKLNIV